MMGSGIFISLEGIDGAGKSSHIESIAAAFKAQGRMVTCGREPGGTPLAEKLRHLVLHDAMDPLTEALLMFAARRDHLLQVIEPALARGEVVLCDRFTDATFAYQGSGRGFELKVLSTLEQWVQATVPANCQTELTAVRTVANKDGLAIRQPDLTLWFDLAPEVAAKRLQDARMPDRFEAESSLFFERVKQGYLNRAEAAPHRFYRLDAAQPQAHVAHQITQILQQKGWLNRAIQTA